MKVYVSECILMRATCVFAKKCVKLVFTLLDFQNPVNANTFDKTHA